MLDWYLIWMLFYWNVPGNCNFLPICFGSCDFVPEELMMDLLLVWVEYPPYQIKALKLARACGVPAVVVRAVDCWQWRSGHYSHQSFLCFFPPLFSSPLLPFLTERVLGSKTYKAKVGWSAQKPGVHPFPDPIGHFGAPWQPILDFWGSHRRNGRIKKLI